MKLSADLVSSEACLVSFRRPPPHRVLLRSPCVSVLMCSSYKDTDHTGLGPTYLTSFDLNDLFKSSVSTREALPPASFHTAFSPHWPQGSGPQGSFPLAGELCPPDLSHLSPAPSCALSHRLLHLATSFTHR